MKIVVKHFADPEETISAIPGKVTVEVEPAEGHGVVGGEPIELTIGQQANVDVEGRITGNESIMGLPPDTRPEVHLVGVTIQAVLDPAPPAEGAMCNGRCIGSPNFGVTVPDKDCPVHGHLPSQVAQGRQAHPDWPAEAVEAQHRQIKAAIEAAVRELRSPQTNEQRARLRDGLQELLDGNAALSGAGAW